MINATVSLVRGNSAFYPLVTNGLSHPYYLDESTFIFRGIRSDFSFLIQSCKQTE